MNTSGRIVQRLDLSMFSDAPPRNRLDLLFIHHSCGGQLFAAPGPRDGSNCIYKTHPESGGLRALLEKDGYIVHEASYGSKIGEKTDVFDWVPKFRDQMEAVFKCEHQDRSFRDDRTNKVVVFKSCFTGNQFQGEGLPPGCPAGPELTLWNAKASYTALRGEFQKYPDVLFICMTTPPTAPLLRPQPLWRVVAKQVLGRGDSRELRARAASFARQFSNWLSATNGWLQDYTLNNVAVFDLYDILTAGGQSDFSAYPTEGGYDSHPSREGNVKVAGAFVAFLNRAVARHSSAKGLNTQDGEQRSKEEKGETGG